MLASFLLFAAEAEACVCKPEWLEVLFPADGAEVPTNARAVILTNELATTSLFVGDEEVEAEWLQVGGRGTYLFDLPELPADAELTLEVEDRDPLGTWHTSDGPDEDPPTAAPDLSVAGAQHRGGVCGETEYVALDVAFPDDDVVLLELAVARGGREAQAVWFLDGPYRLGSWDCDGTLDGVGRDLEVSARFVDAAGNAGPWSEPLSTTIPSCGCATGSSEASIAGILVAAARARRRLRAGEARPVRAAELAL